MCARVLLPRLRFSCLILFVLCGASDFAYSSVASILTAPRQLPSGGMSSFTLTAFETEGRLPVDRAVTVRLLSADRSRSLKLFEGNTGNSGQIRASFEVPADFPDSVLIEAIVSGLAEPLQISAQVQRNVAVLIETDKPIYKPGQKIQGRIILLDSALHPEAGAIEVTVHDAKGLRVARQNLTANRFGVAPFELDLASELNEGNWKIRAESGDSEAVRDLRIEKYTLPKYELEIELEKSWALVDESVSGSVRSDYFFGKPVEGQAVLSAKRWVGVWEEYARLEGDLSEGKWDFRLPPVGFVTGTAGGSGQGLVSLEAQVTDQAGDKLSTTALITISSAPVIVSLIPASESIKPGIPGQIFVQTEVPDGTPRDTIVNTTTRFFSWESKILDESRVDVQTRSGVGTLEVTAPEGTSWVEIEGTAKADGYTARSNVRVGSAFSPSGNFISVIKVGDQLAQVGGQATFRVASAHNGTVYFEVYASGRTVLSDATEEDTFTINITPDMVPRAKVVAYMIADNNEVSADSCSFGVELPVSVQVSADFGTGSVSPGDPVDLVLDAGTGQETMLGISIVDESVLALGRSRLHLQEVFDQLEKTFLEPKIEIHDGGGVGPMPGLGFWEPIQTPGATEVFHDIGLEIVASPGILLPSGGRIDWFDAEVPVAGGGAEKSQDPEEVPRLRQYFPETWLWNPTLLTDARGQARISLTAPDSITGWKLQVVSTVPDLGAGEPGIGFGESNLTVFQDFFVEPTLPYAVVRGEQISIRTSVFNYLDHSQEVELSLDGTTGFELTGEGRRTVTVPSNSVTPVYFDLTPTEIGEHPLRIQAIGESASDAVERPLKVIAEGLPVESIENGVLVPGQVVQFELDFPAEAVQGSERSFLFLSPSPVAQTMEGVSDLLGMPYGCGEQNMIFLAPDVEILKYLRELDELAPEIRAKAEYFINVGYQRQLTYQTTDGGFAAFGGSEGSLWLTAFVLSTFSSAREVRDIDETVLEESAQMLISRQLNDGSFRTDDFLIHQEMDGGIENLFAMTAYVANALADFGDPEVLGAVERAAEYLTDSLDRVWDDSYSLSIAANALRKAAGYEGVADQIVDRLLELAIDDQQGLHWEPYPVETTAYALLALLASENPIHLEATGRVMDWLSTQRNSLGGYGTSTQDTVLAMKAMFQAARKAHREISAELSLRKGQQTLWETSVNGDNFDVLQQYAILERSGKFDLRSEGTGTIAYQIVRRFNLPGEFLPPSNNLEFNVEYSAEHVEVDDIVDVRVAIRYTGEKERTGMVIVDIGVPTGFEPVAETLASLVEKGLVERTEVAGRKVILYLDGLVQGKLVELRFQVRALYPIDAEGTVSQVYEYYDADVKAFAAQPGMLVDQKPREPEIDTLSEIEGRPGERLTVRGSGFTEGILGIWIGGVEVSDFRVLDDSTLELVLPSLPPGLADLRIETNDGTVTLQGSASGLSILPRALYFPIYRSQGPVFTGFAVSNLGEGDAPVQFSAFGDRGEQVAGWPENPIAFDLPAAQQLARLGTELFGHGPNPQNRVWIQAESDSPDLAGCFLIGNGRALDGAEALLGPSSKLYFARVVQGDTQVWGPGAITTISIANPNAGTVEVELLLYPDGDPSTFREPVRMSRPIDDHGMIQGRLSDLFPGLQSPFTGHLEIRVTQGKGVVAAGILELDQGRTLINLLPSEVGPLKVRYAAYVVDAPGVVTRLKLLNVSEGPRKVNLSILNPEGVLEAGPVSVDLAAGGSLERDLRSLFVESKEGVLSGALLVESDGAGVVGDSVWIEPSQRRFAAAMRLQDFGTRKAAFTHVATVGSFFTGLALFNPGQKVSRVEISVFDRQGSAVGSLTVDLNKRQSLTRLIGELIPETRDLVQGYIIVAATEPLIIQESFGDIRGTFLAAIGPSLTGF